MRVALNAARTEIVPVDDIRARWVYPDEGEARRAMEEARKHPLMQARMTDEEKARLRAEEESAKRAAETAVASRRRQPEVK